MSEPSDNAGSLRIPAAFCGVVGMRPTAGLVPHDTRVYGSAPLSVEGPMGRDARDTLLLLCVLASDDPRDPLAGHVDPGLRADLPPLDLSTLKVAFSADLGGFAPIDAHLRDVFETRVRALAPHFKQAEDAAPDLRDADFAYKTLRALAFVGTWEKRMRRFSAATRRASTRCASKAPRASPTGRTTASPRSRPSTGARAPSAAIAPTGMWPSAAWSRRSISSDAT